MELIYNWANENFDTLTQVFLVMILSYLGWKAKNWATLEDIREISFESEKGKNLATKQDIGKITKEVESIRSDFLTQQEIVKKNLQLLLSKELSYQKEERESLFIFHGIISEWIHRLLEIAVHTFNHTNLDSLKSKKEQIDSYYAKAGIAKSRVELLVEDNDLVIAAHELFNEQYKFHSWVTLKLFNLKQILRSQKLWIDSAQPLWKEFEKHKAYLKEITESDKEDQNRRDDLLKEYIDNRNKEYQKVLPLISQFDKLVRRYLKR